MSKWSDFYKSRVGDGYKNYAKTRYAPFINALLAKRTACYAEEGCGIGTISKILRDHVDAELWMVDNDYDMLELVRKNFYSADRSVKDIRSFRDMYGDILMDFQYYPEDTTIHGHGVLEHFSDKAIAMILARQQYQARRVVHYVPTDGYSSPSFGDERLMPWSYWVDTFRPTSFHTFNNRKDLVLIWE